MRLLHHIKHVPFIDMRSSTLSNIALLTTCLLVGESFAAPLEKRGDEVVVTQIHTVTQGAPASHSTNALVPAAASPAPAKSGDDKERSSVKASKDDSSSKRGLPYNDASLLNGFTGGKASWCYNWASSSGNIPKGFTYAPMLHGLDDPHLKPWPKDVESAIASGVTHIQYINEPDVDVKKGGVNTSPIKAASGYKDNMMPYKDKVKLGSPAVSNGVSGGPQGDMGIPYIKRFWKECVGCEFDFVALHWYGDSPAELKKHVQNFRDAAKAEDKVKKDAAGEPKLWITEFGINGGEGNPEKIKSFLEQKDAGSTVLEWLDEQKYVERYAYQWVNEGFLVSGKQPSVAGEVFAGL